MISLYSFAKSRERNCDARYVFSKYVSSLAVVACCLKGKSEAMCKRRGKEGAQTQLARRLLMCRCEVSGNLNGDANRLKEKCPDLGKSNGVTLILRKVSWKRFSPTGSCEWSKH